MSGTVSASEEAPRVTVLCHQDEPVGDVAHSVNTSS